MLHIGICELHPFKELDILNGSSSLKLANVLSSVAQLNDDALGIDLNLSNLLFGVISILLVLNLVEQSCSKLFKHFDNLINQTICNEGI